MTEFIIQTEKNYQYIDFQITNTLTNKFLKVKNNSVYYDQILNQMMWYFDYNQELIYEDFEEICQEILKINYQSINIDFQLLKNLLKEQAFLFIDRLFYFLHSSYNLKSKICEINNQYIIFTTNVEDQKQLTYLLNKANTRAFISELQDSPPNILNSEALANNLQQYLNKYSNLKVTVLDRNAITAAGMNLLLGVNQASYSEPRVVIVEYYNNSQSKEIYGLVGKGITFDSGGYSLKNWKVQQMMKFDMSGAAIVCSTMELLAKYQPKVNVVAVACITDNLIGGHGLLTDSVLTSMNGITVEIQNTDCEGRLVLADGVTYAQRNLNATKIITVATLTGAAQKALGTEYTAGFTNNQVFYDQFKLATNYSYERLWQLPLSRINTKNQQHSRIADIWNEAPSSDGGASNGAGFILQFIENHPFIHLDICGTAGIKQRHGTGIMSSTLADFFIKILN